MNRFTFLSIIILAILGATAFAQQKPPAGGPGASNGLITPKYIKPSDNSTSILLTGLSRERRMIRELPADSDMKLIKDVVYHESTDLEGNPMLLKMDVISYGDDENHPCVVFVVGGGFSFAAKERYLYDRYEVAKAGYVVASVQYHVIENGIYSDAVKDIKAAIRYLRAHAEEYGIDTESMALWGESAGGYLVAMVGTTNGVQEFEMGENLDQSSEVKAVVDVYGLSDLTKIGADYDEEAANSHFTVASPDGKYIHGKNSGLTSLDKPEAVARANPINYVDRDDPPFLLFHGTQDKAVSPSQTLLLHTALREAGVPSTRYVIEGAGHATAEFSDPQDIKIIVDFLDHPLKS